MVPKNYHNFTWNNIYCLLAINLFLKSNSNLIVTSTSNLTASLSTFWFFFADVSIYKHRTWQNCKTHSNFYHSLHIWYHEILTNLIIFKLHLHFLEFLNHLDTQSWSCFLVKMFEISFDFMEKVLNWAK